ncbi:nucleotide sugar dehydrogenase [Candidatus Woesearchaeota archaeon]|nr:nucleotide sugar dehydrogenase [Candidatus Woesearchaeota archaeon]
MSFKICVVGLGYVGLPLAVALSRHFQTVGFDIDEKRISQLSSGHDRTGEVSKEKLKKAEIKFTTDSKSISKSNFIIVSVPTPVTSSYKPDFGNIKSASKIIGKNLSRGSTVVYESTVYPGATEEICVPLLEKYSGLKCGTDFKIGYSPERINPGDKEHTINSIIKVVSGMDEDSLNDIAQVYSMVASAGVYKVSSIKVAEAAKVIENIQRDLNIALMNELSLIFERMEINTREVIAAASTKWNFHPYYPGMVGGHCIGVDPYYLTSKAEQLGYKSEVILAGRGINNFMPIHVSRYIISELKKLKKILSSSSVLFMGLTFKEDVPDLRNSKAKDMIDYLRQRKVNIIAHEPLLSVEDVKRVFSLGNTSFKDIPAVDCIVLYNAHSMFKSLTLESLKRKSKKSPILVDIKSFFNKEDAIRNGFIYKSL